MKETVKLYGISEVLEKFGAYQLVQYVLACLPAIFITMININYVFVAGDLNYRCRVPECDYGTNLSQSPAWWPNATIDRCSRPVLRPEHAVGDTCNPDSFTNVTQQCEEWVYESNNTVIAELNLGCQPWRSSLIGTVHSVGMVVSMIVAGWMCDRIGRKPTMIICSVGSCVGFFKTFATSYEVYIFLEFLESAFGGGTYSAGSVLMIEIGGKDTRILAGVLFAYAVYFGETVFAVIAMLVPYWKNLIRIINIPSLLVLSYIVIMKESPRWQIVNGKSKEAVETLKLAASWNKITIKNEDLHLDEKSLQAKFDLLGYEKKESLKEVFSSKEILKRLFVGAVSRFTAGFVYYGMVINSVFLPGDKYTNFMLSTVMSFPGELIAMYLMNKVGRRLPLVYGYMICGVMCIASGYVPVEYAAAKIALFLMGKMVISACYTGAITYSMELFPTSARGFLLGICALSAQIGCMLAPLTPILTTVYAVLPSIFFGCCALLSGLLLTQTPETKDMPLMDTVVQVEASARATRDKKNLTIDKINKKEELDHAVSHI